MKRRGDCSIWIILSIIIIIFSHIWQCPFGSWVYIEILLGLILILKNSKAILWEKALGLVCVTSILYFFSNAYNGNGNLNIHVISILFYLPLAIAICVGHYSVNKIMYAAIGIAIFLIFDILNRGADDLFLDTSRNSVSVFLMLSISPIVLRWQSLDNKLQARLLLFSILGFIAAVLAIGRGGIICMSIFLLGNVFNSLFSKSNRKGLLLFVLIGAIIIAFIYIMSHQEIYELIFSRFIEKSDTDLQDEPRYLMNMEYLSNLNNPMSFLFGAGFDKCPTIAFYNNPHNTFVYIHGNYGIIWLLVWTFVFIKSILLFVKIKQWLPCFYIAAILIRLTSDTLAGPGVLDIILFYFILSNYNNVRYEAA